MDNESILISKTITVLAELDLYLEKLSNESLAKINICSKTKELVFWLQYYKDELEE